MATAADWMSGASFVAMAGGIYFKGYGYMALLVGWTGGYVLVASLLAPYLRKFGCYTVPGLYNSQIFLSMVLVRMQQARNHQSNLQVEPYNHNL